MAHYKICEGKVEHKGIVLTEKEASKEIERMGNPDMANK